MPEDAGRQPGDGRGERWALTDLQKCLEDAMAALLPGQSDRVRALAREHLAKAYPHIAAHNAAPGGRERELREALERIANHHNFTRADGSRNPDWAWSHISVSEFAQSALDAAPAPAQTPLRLEAQDSATMRRHQAQTQESGLEWVDYIASDGTPYRVPKYHDNPPPQEAALVALAREAYEFRKRQGIFDDWRARYDALVAQAKTP